MHALIPLLFIFIAINSAQLKSDKFYRANVFALVGVSYFFILQYIFYWYEVFPVGDWVQYVPGLIVVITTVLIALSSWNRKSHPAKTAALSALCASALVAVFAFDKELKEKIAEVGGFFEGKEITAGFTPTATSYSVLNVPMIGLQLEAPDHWQKRNLPSGHLYLAHHEHDAPTLEIRPNCLGEIDVDTPTYVRNTLELFEANSPEAQSSVQCSMASADKTCLVRVGYAPASQIKEKWRWLRISDDSAQSVVVDVILYSGADAFEPDIWRTILSVRKAPKTAEQVCRTPAAWL